MSTDQEQLVDVVSLNLTKAELQFVRDLFGILLPPDGQVTVSESLAGMTGRNILERKLWAKIYETCKQSKVAVGDSVPDYIVVTTSQPEMAIGMLEHRASGDDEDNEKEGISSLFEDAPDSEESNDEG